MTTKKNETTTSSSSSSRKKECLIDLVEASPVPYWKMVMDLSRTGLDKQLEKEITQRKYGETITPTITETEFNKKILGE